MHEAEAGPAGTIVTGDTAPPEPAGAAGEPSTSGSHRAAAASGPARLTEPPAADALAGTRPLRLATLAVLATAVLILAPTVGDFGLTWDEPAYRYSQVMSEQWWREWSHVRSWDDVRQQLDPDTLLYYWPYARHGINFHPPLAGQLNLAAHAVFGPWMKDIPSRRMSSVIAFAVTIAIGFTFLARRYGVWVGLVMADSLLFMPRLYGQAHLIDTDIPGLLLWSATAIAFWKGLYEPEARRWRVLVGILLGLAFVEKMGAVMVLLPLLGWLAARALRPVGDEPGQWRRDWLDGLLTTGAMLAPLALAFQQIQLLQRQLPPPERTNLLIHRPASDWTGAILAIPLGVWIFRRLLGWLFPRHKVWGVERPALEIWTAILAFAPVVGWLGNPAWWRETLPRLAHYYTLSTARQGTLPDIQIIYFGQIYEYSLPWHNAWVLMAITVPVTILAAAAIGVFWGLGRVGRDRIPLYFLVHLVTLPVVRMFPTPAHDGVRLFLPTFFFLAAFAGWGAVALADGLAWAIRRPGLASWTRPILATIVLVPAAVALVGVHPYELSYYNELIGGPRGAWQKGFELTYWYDAFNGPVLDEVNSRLPEGAEVDFLNDKTNPVTFQELQSLGALRKDIRLVARRTDRMPYVWLLTQDSKASAFTRLLFGMRPWYASRPPELDGARVATVADPVAVSRAWGLFVLLDAADRSPKPPPAAPAWVRQHVPWLGRLWGDGLILVHRLGVKKPILDWSRTDPEGLLAAAKVIASGKPLTDDSPAQRLFNLIVADPSPETREKRRQFLRQLLAGRAQGLVEAVLILNAHRDEVVAIMTRYAYTDPEPLGGYLDRDLPQGE